MTQVQIFRDLSAHPASGEEAGSVGGVRISFLVEADKSDPLNQMVAVVARFNERLALRAAVLRIDHKNAEAAAIEALVGAVIEYHAEIRDALAEKS